MDNEKDANEGKKPITINPADIDSPPGDQDGSPKDGGADRNRSGGRARSAARSPKRYVN